MDMREEFEAWIKTYDINPSLCGYCEEDGGEWYYDEFHVQRSWMGWKAALQSQPATGSGAEPVAILCREIGESSWFDHVPVKPGSDRHHYLNGAPEWDTCHVYTHPAPTAQDSEIEKELEKEIIQRDYWEEKATELALEVGEYFGIDVGEHSNSNCPVRAAIEIFQLGEYSLSAAQDSKVPEGFTLVPNEITDEMADAYFKVIDRNLDRVTTDARFGRYDSQKQACRAMLSAAPSLAEKPKQGEEWTVSVYQHHAENYPRVSLHAPDSGIFSDWFDDVALTISGNFENGEKKIQCADAICAALNFTGNAHPVPEKPQWVSCGERLPTEADGYVWAWDADTKEATPETWFQVVGYRDRYDYTHWQPTGLQRPQPPENL